MKTEVITTKTEKLLTTARDMCVRTLDKVDVSEPLLVAVFNSLKEEEENAWQETGTVN